VQENLGWWHESVEADLKNIDMKNWRRRGIEACAVTEFNKNSRNVGKLSDQWPTERGGWVGGDVSEVLTKPSRIPCSMENTSATT
jgi:hypothetical protein